MIKALECEELFKKFVRDFWIQAQGVIPQILWQAYNHSQDFYVLTAKSLIQKDSFTFPLKHPIKKLIVQSL